MIVYELALVVSASINRAADGGAVALRSFSFRILLAITGGPHVRIRQLSQRLLFLQRELIGLESRFRKLFLDFLFEVLEFLLNFRVYVPVIDVLQRAPRESNEVAVRRSLLLYHAIALIAVLEDALRNRLQGHRVVIVSLMQIIMLLLIRQPTHGRDLLTVHLVLLVGVLV